MIRPETTPMPAKPATVAPAAAVHTCLRRDCEAPIVHVETFTFRSPWGTGRRAYFFCAAQHRITALWLGTVQG